ncbi:hypothetical protein [Nonomuraea sp. NPDC005501]|uniref:hypothetical protein n=1 Tax=Nonomuraea sp. NPDC005501 TaxID=3156884 RepID=UPI0033B1463D
MVERDPRAQLVGGSFRREGETAAVGRVADQRLGPFDITDGPDDNLWATEDYVSQLAVVTP